MSAHLSAVDPTSIAIEDERRSIVIHSPQPIYKDCAFDPNDFDAVSPLVAQLEQAALVAIEHERQENLRKSRAFRHEITEPVRWALINWNRSFNDTEATCYWDLRLIIENNLACFLNAPYEAVRNLKNIVNRSHIPYSLKKTFYRFLMDYYFNYESSFWRYHYYYDGIYYLSHSLPTPKKSFTDHVTYYPPSGDY